MVRIPFQKETCIQKAPKALVLRSTLKDFETRIESLWIRKTASSIGVKLVLMQTTIP